MFPGKKGTYHLFKVRKGEVAEWWWWWGCFLFY